MTCTRMSPQCWSRGRRWPSSWSRSGCTRRGCPRSTRWCPCTRCWPPSLCNLVSADGRRLYFSFHLPLIARGYYTCHTGTTKGANCVGTDGVRSTIIWEVSISALIHIPTPDIGLMVAVAWSHVTCDTSVMWLLTDLYCRCSSSCPLCWCRTPCCLCSSCRCGWSWLNIHWCPNNL